MSDHEQDEITDLSDKTVTTKYQTAALICNQALEKVIAACAEGADISDLCAIGDQYIEEECSKVYNKKVKGEAIEKGVAFPTCVTPNALAGHYSPLKGEAEIVKGGDVLKIDMGVHIDGFIATAAHTLVVASEEITDRRADVVQCAWNAAEAVLRVVRVGNSSTRIPEIVDKVAKDFKCNPMAGVYSMQVERFNIDGGENIVPNRAMAEQPTPEFEFEANEAYSIDISMSTGDGRGKQSELRSTVYRRNDDVMYGLRTAKGRQFLHLVNTKYPVMAFSLRQMEDQVVAKVGVAECKRHDLVSEYPVMMEKKGEFIAQFKFTVLLLPGGSKKVTGMPFTQGETLKSSFAVTDEEVKKLLAESANPKKQKLRKKNAEKKIDAELARK